MGEQRKRFLEMEAAPDENGLKFIGMTTKDLDCFLNQLIKHWQGLRGLPHILEQFFVGKMLSNSIAWQRKLFVKGRVNQCCELHCCLTLRNCHSHTPSATTILPSQQPSTSRKDSPKRLQLTEGSGDSQQFVAKKYVLIKICTYVQIAIANFIDDGIV